MSGSPHEGQWGDSRDCRLLRIVWLFPLPAPASASAQQYERVDYHRSAATYSPCRCIWCLREPICELFWQRWHILRPVSYTHLRAHETVLDLVCRLLLEKK